MIENKKVNLGVCPETTILRLIERFLIEKVGLKSCFPLSVQSVFHTRESPLYKESTIPSNGILLKKTRIL